jgi:hypothetical protein
MVSLCLCVANSRSGGDGTTAAWAHKFRDNGQQVDKWDG